MSSRAPALVQLMSTATAQAGAFTRQQALASGFTSRQIQLRLSTGAWLALLAGVYISAGTPTAWLTWAWAGVIDAGPGSALVGESAAAVRGWASQSWPITIAVPENRRMSWVNSQLRAIQMDVPSAEVLRAAGLPITTRLRMAVDVAHLLPLAEAQQLLDRWLVLDRIDLASLTEAINQSRRRGSAQARLLMRSAADLAASEAERIAQRLFRRSGLPGFAANYAVKSAGRMLKVDLAFVAAKVAIEIKGWAFHSAPDRGRADDAKITELQLAGWFVITFSWFDLVDRPDYVIAKVQQVLAARAAA